MRQKLERLDKLRGKERKGANDGAPDISTIRGCPVPEPILCSGKRSDATLDDGILMECTNLSCPFKEVPVHDFCFATYEDHLVRMMGSMGSARGWTESQRRSNLWEKKGQALVAKAGRCRCGQGTTRRNEDAFYARQKKKHQEALQVNAANGKKKAAKPKAKELPKLQFTAKNTTQPTVITDRPSRPIVKPVTLSYKKRASSALSSVSHEDAEAICSRIEATTESELIRAPLPPRQIISYANATRPESEKEHEGGGDFKVPSSVHDDSGVEMKNDGSSVTFGFSDLSKVASSPISSSGHSSLEYSDNLMEYVSPAKTPITSRNVFRHEYVEIKKIVFPVLSIREDDNLANMSFHYTPSPDKIRKSGKGSRFSFTHWSPMFGCGFNLGESLIAAKYLPDNY